MNSVIFRSKEPTEGIHIKWEFVRSVYTVVQKPWRSLERFWSSVYIGRLKKLGPDVPDVLENSRSIGVSSDRVDGLANTVKALLGQAMQSTVVSIGSPSTGTTHLHGGVFHFTYPLKAVLKASAFSTLLRYSPHLDLPDLDLCCLWLSPSHWH